MLGKISGVKFSTPELGKELISIYVYKHFIFEIQHNKALT
jgi:hypothetical protein